MSAPAMDRPRGLWSLWDMLERYALLFGDSMAHLLRLHSLWGPSSLLNDNAGPVASDSESDAHIRKWRSDDTLASLEALRKLCVQTGMGQVEPEITRIYADLASSLDLGLPAITPVKDRLKYLYDRLRDELQHEYFVHVGRADAALYGKPSPFGERVGKKFNKATEDIEEAGKCLAVQQHTACVFHLMRVMEIGVRTLGKKLRVTIDVETENWAKIMDHVDGAVRKLPAQTEKEKRRKAQLGGASANLNGVRIATRNEVMHPKQTYTRDQAHDVYNATRLFMDHLADLV